MRDINVTIEKIMKLTEPGSRLNKSLISFNSSDNPESDQENWCALTYLVLEELPEMGINRTENETKILAELSGFAVSDLDD